MEHRNSLVEDATPTQASGTAERETTLDMVGPQRWSSSHHIGCIQRLQCVTLRDGRDATLRPEYEYRDTAVDVDHTSSRLLCSQRIRKRIEEVIAWARQAAECPRLALAENMASVECSP